MNIDTGSFKALSQRVTDLEADITGLTRLVEGGDHNAMRVILDAFREMGRQEGRDKVLGIKPQRTRPRHLRLVQ
jgi:hypothetical protein